MYKVFYQWNKTINNDHRFFFCIEHNNIESQDYYVLAKKKNPSGWTHFNFLKDINE